MDLYKFKFYYSLQHYYTEYVYKLVKVDDRPSVYFGYNAEWLNLNTNEHLDIWCHCMEKLSLEEIRDFKLKKLIDVASLEM